MNVTFFLRPDGRQETHRITNITDADAHWFETNDVSVSMEDCGEFFTFYADCGLRVNDDPDEDPDEQIIITGPHEKCEDAMSRLRAVCEHAMSEAEGRA